MAHKWAKKNTKTTPLGNATLPNAQLEWSCVDDEAWKLNSHALKPDTPPTHNLESEERESQDYSLVITGDVFRWMLNYAPMDTLQRVRLLGVFCISLY